ncbi:MAG: hypothetical protein HYY17_16040 [Planctomycetes bacterium]|nr:hypothetical protein [Planctomycetota bacterium]
MKPAAAILLVAAVGGLCGCRPGKSSTSVAAESAGQDSKEGFEGRRSATEIHPGWESVRDSEHPSWNDVSVVDDTASARSGDAFLRFRTRGGATAFQQRLKHAHMLAPERSYSLSVYVRIPPAAPDERPRANQASIEIRWLDRRGRLLRVDKSVGVATAPSWTSIFLEVAVAPAEAVWAQLRLCYDGPDVRGECDFDDLLFEGQPRIRIEPAGREIPVFRPGEPAVFRISVPTSVTGEPTLSLALRDALGRDVAAPRTRALGERRSVTETFDLPGAGYFELHVRLESEGALVGRKTSPVLAPEPARFPRRSGRALGVVFNPYRDRYHDVAALTELLGFQRAKIVAWDLFAGRRAAEPDLTEIVSIVRAAMEAEASAFIAVLAHPPASLFPTADPNILREPPLALFSLGRKNWEAGLQKTVERFSELLTDWQIGPDGETTAGFTGPADAILGEVLRAIRTSSRIARVGVPVSSTEAPTVALSNARFFAVYPRDWTTPERFAQRVEVPGRESHLAIALPPLGPPDIEGARQKQAAEFLKRLVFVATSGGTGGAYVPLSGDPQTGMIDADGYPLATALVLRVANDILSGARHDPKSHLFPPPIRDFVFEKEGQMTVVLWSESGSVPVETFLGYEARLIDPLGASRSLDPGTKFEVGPEPRIMVGVDPLLLKTQVSCQIHRKPEPPETEPPVWPTLPLRADPPVRLLRITNHFDEDIKNVKFAIRDPIPAGWTIRPREDGVSLLAKGRTLERELTITLPPSEQDGTRELTIEFSFIRIVGGKEKLYELKLRRVITLIPEAEVIWRVEPIDGDRERRRIWISVMNRADHTLNLRGWLYIPGLPDQQIAITGLKVNKDESLGAFEFRLEGGNPATVEVRLEEAGGRRVFINKAIPVK